MNGQQLKELVSIVSLWILFVQGQLDGNSDCPVSPDHFEEKEPPQAVIGADVVLPCFPKFSTNVNHDILEWSKGNHEIYVIRNKFIIINNGTLSASIEEVEKGNASLYLSGVKKSDEGRYCCCIRMNGKPTCTVVTLAVKEEDEETSTERPGNLQIPPTEAPTNSTGRVLSDTQKWIIGFCVPAGLIFLILAAVLIYHCWKKNHSADVRRRNNQNHQEEDEGIELKVVDEGAAEN